MLRNLARLNVNYLGQGSFSCAYKNIFNCEDSRLNKDGNYVTKIFDSNQQSPNFPFYKQMFDEEQNIAKLLSQIDPENYYFIYNVNDCKIDIQQFNQLYRTPNEKGKQCTIQFTEPYGTFQPYGGKTLEDKINENDKKFITENLYGILLGLIECVKKLQSINPIIVHNDIKADNIVLEPKIRLIDWGVVIRGDGFILDNRGPTAHMPPFVDIYYNNTDLGKQINQELYNTYWKYLYNNEYHHTLLHILETDFETYKKGISENLHKIDVYSIGFMFINIREYFKLPFSQHINDLLNHMTNVNPTEQYDINQSYDELIKIMSLIKM